MMLFESLIFNLLPAAVGIMAVVLVFESCWRKCPPDKLMIVSGAGKMRSVSGKGTFVIPLLQRVDTLSLGAVQVQLTTENDIPTQDAILIHACAVANFQIGQTPELIETAPQPRRAFQGWRYLEAGDAPPDLPTADGEAIEPELAKQLRELGAW